MSKHIDSARLAQAVRDKRGIRSLRTVSEYLGDGISPSTLSRVENEQSLDLDTYAALCEWLNVPFDTFFIQKPRPEAKKKVKIRIIAADRSAINAIAIQVTEMFGGNLTYCSPVSSAREGWRQYIEGEVEVDA